MFLMPIRSGIVNFNQGSFLMGPWDIHPIADLKEIDKTNFENSIVILDQFDFKPNHSIYNP